MFDENRDLRNQLTEALKKIEDLEHQLTETENTYTFIFAPAHLKEKTTK